MISETNKKIDKASRRGFSLIELMVAITIGMMVIGASMYMATTYFAYAARNATKTTLQSLKINIDMYKAEKGSYPENLAQLKKSGFWKGKDIPKDAWDRSFVYRLTPEGKNPYELFSYGPDGKGSPKESRINIADL